MLQRTHLGNARMGRDAPVDPSLGKESSIAMAAALEGHHAVASHPAAVNRAIGACAQEGRIASASTQRLQKVV